MEPNLKLWVHQCGTRSPLGCKNVAIQSNSCVKTWKSDPIFMLERGNPIQVSLLEYGNLIPSTHHNHMHKYIIKIIQQMVIHDLQLFVHTHLYSVWSIMQRSHTYIHTYIHCYKSLINKYQTNTKSQPSPTSNPSLNPLRHWNLFFQDYFRLF